MDILPDREAEVPVLPGRQWSPQQDAIFEWFRSGTGNLVVEARAGTGKTTTIIEGINRAPENKIVLAAFNARIAKTLQERMENPNAVAKTVHGLGCGIVMSSWNGVRIEGNDERFRRSNLITNTACDPHRRNGVPLPFNVIKLVTKMHNKAREIRPHASEWEHIRNLAIDFDMEPEEEMERDGYDMVWFGNRTLEAMEFAAANKPTETGIDFADMIFLPIRNKWLRPRYNLGVVDETQDLTSAQLEIIMGMVNGRICIIGDSRQAIYSFRGASVGSMDRLKATLDAKVLGLTTTYRCGKSIVKLARAIVPDFSAADGNPEGEIVNLHMDKLVETAQYGDFILSRVNAPLVSIALSLILANKRAKVAGRDIGEGLKAILDKLKAKSIPDLMTKLGKWEEKGVERLRKADREDAIPELHDKANTIIVMAQEAKSVGDVYDRIVNLFTDNGLGDAGVVTCSSIHKAKGLEADRVFILKDTLQVRKPGNSEESNLAYVAITRAKTKLTWVVE